MWKRGGQSSALDRAQALLSGKKSGREVSQSTQGPPGKTQATKTRPPPPDPHVRYSDLSDLSSLSSAPEHGAETTGSTATEKNQGSYGYSKDYKPLGGAGSRFLKKGPPPVTNSSQSPVIRSHVQKPEPRHVSPSQRSSQFAVLSRLAQIENRIHSRMQPQEQAREGPQPAQNLTSEPPKVVTHTIEASTLPISAESSSDQSSKGRRFLKKKASAALDSKNTAASVTVQCQVSGVRSLSRAAAAVSLGSLVTKSVKVTHCLSLESDEEDMRKLLGDSLISTDSNSYSRQEKISSLKQPDKLLKQKADSVPPSATVKSVSSNKAPLPPSTSPSHRSSPFRFTGQAQTHFSPSAISPSPSPACVSPSLSRRLSSHNIVDSPERSVSAMSGHSEVLSLEELFPVHPVYEELHSVMSVSSEDFKLNVMTLDDLVPATLGFTGKTPGKQSKEHDPPLNSSTDRQEELLKDKKALQQQEEKEEEEDYPSDFDSEIRTEGNYSANQVSEQLLGDEVEVEAAPEVREEALDSYVSYRRTEDDYSSSYSDSSRYCTSQTSDYSDTSESLSRGSRSQKSHGSRASSPQSGRHPAARRVLKEATVQTQPETMAHTWSTGTSGPALGVTYMNPNSVAIHSLSAETVQAFSTYNPAVFVLNQMLKQQLAATRQFIESNRHLHANLVRSLEPPNYRYTKLEDTKEYIRMHRPPSLTMEQVLKDVMSEIKEDNCTVCD